jgi:hypothetical protein
MKEKQYHPLFNNSHFFVSWSKTGKQYPLSVIIQNLLYDEGMYRLYTEVQVSTLFTQPRAEGPRLCKSRRDRTEVYNRLVPWATWP